MKLKETYSDLKLLESKNKNKFRAKFIEADTATKNGRVYPLSVLQKAVRDFSKRLEISNASFKSHSSSEIKDVSHLIEKIWMEGKAGYIEGRLIPTAVGKDAMAIIENGGKIGVSMRGTGTIQKRNNEEIVQPDYELQSIDLALNPAFDRAHIRPLGEAFTGRKKQMNEKDIEQKYMSARSAGFDGKLSDYKTRMSSKSYQDKTMEFNYVYSKKCGYSGTYEDYKKAVEAGKIKLRFQKFLIPME
ncbi:hypothetical protein GF354_05190 [Candidatus Peregrinibacteria bacterium]|nr:hypothetical protein [Candidatus Peregrinibacteria bacterium]